ncbi:ABC transporter substrate-binding protein [Streptomyces antimicrobicus]|uniref:ABC transporter substrate-binding protein n=1 Tax=Streptomyces antimicrobicus TaxID=2883108 RepID=A0ABS8B129_9ACTN|nr:ABC transporter substrate-binding protein [Streptomyces antimicrobicus]MCB5178319.1 ABC transporter substrate-binding protein [Streptomyces antimicrobicus]
MSERRRTTRLRSLLAVTTGVCLLAGCGVLPGTSGGSGETLTVVTFAPEGTKATNMSGMTAMAKAYARWVNSKGGINGHKLRVLTCNERNTPTGAADCARQAVAEKAVAVVGSYSQHGRAFMAPLEAAGIPFIGGYGVSAEEFQSTLSFPVNGGQPALLAGAGHQLARTCEQVALVRPDTLVGDSMPVLLNAGLRATRQMQAADIRAAEDAGDYGPQAREAMAEVGRTKDRGRSCVTAVLGARTETFFDSFRRVDQGQGPVQASGPQAPRKPQIASVLGSVSQALVDRTGGKESPFEGAYVTGWYPVATDPLWDHMRKVVADFAFGDDDADPADDGTQTTWIAYTVLSEILKQLGGQDVTARSVARALNRTEGVSTGGLTPDLRWRFQDLRAVGGYPRLTNARVSFQLVQAGRLVAQPGDQPSMDMTQTLEAAPRS